MTPEIAWKNLLSALLGYDEPVDVESEMYKAEIDKPEPIALVKEVLETGVVLDESTSMHWAIDIMGAFEITRRDYKSPVGIDTNSADNLAEYIYKMFGIDLEDM